jgi:hypothetical protein
MGVGSGVPRGSDGEDGNTSGQDCDLLHRFFGNEEECGACGLAGHGEGSADGEDTPEEEKSTSRDWNEIYEELSAQLTPEKLSLQLNPAKKGSCWEGSSTFGPRSGDGDMGSGNPIVVACECEEHQNCGVCLRADGEYYDEHQQIEHAEHGESRYSDGAGTLEYDSECEGLSNVAGEPTDGGEQGDAFTVGG